jgi:hypothetical protein
MLMNTAQKLDLCEYVLSDYSTGGRERSAYKNIPIELLPYVREYFKLRGLKIAVRYRGSRTNPRDYRPRSQRMQDCVKEFADRFSVYYR